MGQFVHYYTLYGSIRPFGTAIMLAGYDQDTKKSSFWICEETNWQHHLVPDNLRDEVNEWAVQSIKEDEMADDDDDDDE
ncbi:unnamed protein product [Phytophthora lilii]|uniref:Unnamed protein product n=1 Tax=Phytophthora lilii TaxID=2077276 RepID=A0A9W6TF49_9STRA|nr:unnamed protein product [Phytophthora lilii]